MEEARIVLERLDRIDALDRQATPPGVLLAEVRALLTEAEAWLEVERVDPPETRAVLRRTEDVLARASPPEASSPGERLPA